jgi:hypothetical protein
VTDETTRIRDDSDHLLEALQDLKHAEAEKRTADISTPKFHDLAEEVEQKAKDLFELAHDAKRAGNRTRTRDRSTNEVPPRHSRRRASADA